MKTRQQKIKDSVNDEIRIIADDLDQVSAISALADQKGGQVLVKSLLKDIISNVDTLCAKYSTLTTQEFVSFSSDIKNKLDLVRVLKRAKNNKKYLETLLEEALLLEDDE